MPQVASIQRGSRSVVSADGTSFTITLGAEVEIGAAIVMHSTSYPSTTTIRDNLHTLTMELEASGGGTSGYYDRIRVRRSGSGFAFTVSVQWEVVEFDPATLGAGGVQWGRDTSFTGGSPTSKSISVSDVDSAVVLLAWETNNFNALFAGSVLADITSTTNLDLLASATFTASVAIVWQVIDFDAADVAVQTGTITLSGGASAGASSTATISAVDLDATLLVGCGVNLPNYGSGSISRTAWGLQLTDSTTVTAFVGVWGSDSDKSATIGYQAVEFLDGAVVHSGVFAFGASDTTATSSTFSPALDADRTSAWPVSPNIGNVDGKNTLPSQDAAITFRYTLDITTGVDSVTATRNAHASVAVDTWWQAIEFSSGAGGGSQSASMTAGMSAGAAFAAVAAALASLAAAAEIFASLAGVATGAATVSAGMSASASLAASAAAVATVSFGATSGATWSAVAEALAEMSAGAELGSAATTSPVQTADMSAGASLSAGFAATAAALASISTSLTATDVMAAVANAVASLTAGAELGATWSAEVNLTMDGIALYATVSVVPALQAGVSVGPALTATVEVTPALRGRIRLH